jgi:cell division septum initiation protein DivIVA
MTQGDPGNVTTLNEESVVPEFAHAVRGYDRYQVDDYIERLNEWAAGAHARALEAESTAQRQAEEIRALRDHLAEVEDERPAPPDHALKAAAERAAETVTVAVQQADEIRRRASAAADHRLDEAGRQAVAIVEAARQSVAGLSEEAVKERRDARLRIQALFDDAAAQIEELRRRAGNQAETALADARTEAASIVAEADQMTAEIRARSDADRRQAGEALERLQSERTEIMGDLSRLRGAIQTLISGAQSISHLESDGADDPEGEPDPAEA